MRPWLMSRRSFLEARHALREPLHLHASRKSLARILWHTGTDFGDLDQFGLAAGCWFDGRQFAGPFPHKRRAHVVIASQVVMTASEGLSGPIHRVGQRIEAGLGFLAQAFAATSNDLAVVDDPVLRRAHGLTTHDHRGLRKMLLLSGPKLKLRASSGRALMKLGVKSWPVQ